MSDTPVKQYQMPFEAEVGLQPSLEDMQDVVVTRKQRPKFSADWLQDVVSVDHVWCLSLAELPHSGRLAVCFCMTA